MITLLACFEVVFGDLKVSRSSDGTKHKTLEVGIAHFVDTEREMLTVFALLVENVKVSGPDDDLVASVDELLEGHAEARQNKLSQHLLGVGQVFVLLSDIYVSLQRHYTLLRRRSLAILLTIAHEAAEAQSIVDIKSEAALPHSGAFELLSHLVLNVDPFKRILAAPC